MDSSKLYSEVDQHYGSAARASDDGKYSQRVANAFGYSQEDLVDMPEEANLGLSCGNPFALANLKEGETVVDLGSGAGFDVFQAAKKVGGTGKAIGIDFNKDMLDRANKIKTKLNATNVDFVESRIDKISLPDSHVDCVISNCVINLVPEEEKQLVFHEMFRILKPGGRVAVSDILAKGEMPTHIKNDMALYVGCISGASQVSAYEKYLTAAGFSDILLVDAKSDLNVYYTTDGESGPCCGPPVSKASESAKTSCGPNNAKENGSTSSCGPKTASAPKTSSAKACCGPSANGTDAPNSNETDSKSNGARVDFNEFAASYKIYAIKP